MTNNKFFLVPAPGHYSGRARVLSSHSTYEAAQRAARSWGAGVVIREGALGRGDQWFQSAEPVYRRV